MLKLFMETGLRLFENVRRLSALHVLRCVGFVAALFYMQLAVAGENSLSVEAFARKMDVPFMSVSPDGSKLATAISNGYESRLVLLDVASLTPIVLEADLHEVSDVRWIDNTDLLAVAEDVLDIDQVYRVNIVTQKVTALSKFTHSEGRSLNEEVRLFPSYTYAKGMARIWRSYYRQGADLFTLNLPDNVLKQELHFNHPSDAYFPDPDSNIRLMEEWKGDAYKVTFRASETDEPTLLTNGTEFDAEQMHPIARKPNTLSLYVSVTGGDRDLVQLYDIGEKKLGPVVLADEKYDVRPVPEILPYSGEVVGMRYSADKPRIVYFDPEIKSLMASVDKALPERINTLEGASADRSVLVILSESDRQPGEYFLLLPKQKKLEKVLGRAEWLPEKELSRRQLVHFNARDGLPIEAYLTVPQHAAPGAPLVVLPHGGPHSRDEWEFDSWAEFLASRGYAVIQPNYRISTGYGQAFFDKGLKEVGYAIQNDIFDSLAWAQKQGYGKGGNVCIMGGSFGGYAAMRAATQEPAAFKCVIAMAGFYDIVELLKADEGKPFYSLMTRMYGDPASDKARLVDASPLHFVAALQAPVLVIHGKLDERVNSAQATELIRELDAQKKVYETLIRPEEGHSFHKQINRERMLEAVERFLQKYLQAAPVLSSNSPNIKPGQP